MDIPYIFLIYSIYICMCFDFWGYLLDLGLIFWSFGLKAVFFELLHAKPSFRNYLKKSILELKCAKLDRKSDYGHVQTYC